MLITVTGKKIALHRNTEQISPTKRKAKFSYIHSAVPAPVLPLPGLEGQ